MTYPKNYNILSYHKLMLNIPKRQNFFCNFCLNIFIWNTFSIILIYLREFFAKYWWMMELIFFFFLILCAIHIKSHIFVLKCSISVRQHVHNTLVHLPEIPHGELMRCDLKYTTLYGEFGTTDDRIRNMIGEASKIEVTKKDSGENWA